MLLDQTGGYGELSWTMPDSKAVLVAGLMSCYLKLLVGFSS